jgi:hypothetical protein
VPKFTDTTFIRVKAGNGGKGAVSFHREKFIAMGGPDGGDGGKGGSVFIASDIRLYNLSHLFRDRQYKAEPGHQGMAPRSLIMKQAKSWPTWWMMVHGISPYPGGEEGRGTPSSSLQRFRHPVSRSRACREMKGRSPLTLSS